MKPVKRLSIEFRGERIEIVAGLVEKEVELREVKDLIKAEYQRRGYIPADLTTFDDEYDRTSLYFGTYANGTLLAAARLIDSEKLPTESLYYEFNIPRKLSPCSRSLIREVSRLTAIKRPGDNPLPRHFVSTTMISALIDYGFKAGLCGGVSTIKLSFMRLFEHLDLPAWHEIPGARLVYPRGEILSGFFYDDVNPAVPIYYLHDEAKAIFDGLFRNSVAVDERVCIHYPAQGSHSFLARKREPHARGEIAELAGISFLADDACFGVVGENELECPPSRLERPRRVCSDIHARPRGRIACGHEPAAGDVLDNADSAVA